MPVDTPAWVRHAVFYQVFPDRLARSTRLEPPGEFEPWDAPATTYGFKGGDLYGVVEHLDRLRGLGINALYLNPVFTSAANHRYHTDDYFHVDPLLGGDAALRELIDEAHQRDLRVVLDGVFNHCGRGLWPFHHVLENGAASPYRDWFYLDPAVRSGDRAVTAFPGASELAAMTAMRTAGAEQGSISRSVLGYEAWWDLPALPKLDLSQSAVREMVFEVAEHSLRFGIDGWRLDVVEDVDGEVWREFRRRVRAVNAEAYLVGEVWHPKPEWLDGDHFDAYMNYPLMEAILGFAAGSHLDGAVLERAPDELAPRPLDAEGFVARVTELHHLYDPAAAASQLNLLGSHDAPRMRSMCGGDLDSVRLAMLLQMTLPGAPCVYYGDEIGMEGGMDPDCRGSFPTDTSTWERDPYGWLADAIALRTSSRALRDGEFSFLRVEGEAVAFLRGADAEAIIVAVNAGVEALTWELDLPAAFGEATVVPLRGNGDPGPRASLAGAQTLRMQLTGRDGTVVRLDRARVPEAHRPILGTVVERAGQGTV